MSLGPPERRRHAVAIDERAPHLAGVDAGQVNRRSKRISHRVNRHQIVAQRHPAGRELGVHADAFEPAEAEQVRRRSRARCAIDSGWPTVVSTIDAAADRCVARPRDMWTAATGLPR